MAFENIDELIALKLVGELDEEGERQLESWLATSAENKMHFEQMQKIWDAGNVDENFNPDVESAWAKVSKELHLTEEPKVIQMPRRNNNLVIRIAAAVVIVLGIALVFTNKLSKPEMILVASLSNEQKEVILPDQSKVFLNANSSIEYPEDFNGDTREVKLEGEAFFEITKDAEHPFIIHTQEVYTKVLGTSFNILARKNSSQIVVSVKTGKVEVGLKGSKVNLEPGYEAKVDLTNRTLNKSLSSSDNYLSWKTKEMYFNDVTIEYLISFLSSYYNVTITANKELLPCHFTGNFNNASLTDILNVLGLSNGIKYTIDNKNISLEGQACQ